MFLKMVGYQAKKGLYKFLRLRDKQQIIIVKILGTLFNRTNFTSITITPNEAQDFKIGVKSVEKFNSFPRTPIGVEI
jgi:hypothetical protein